MNYLRYLLLKIVQRHWVLLYLPCIWYYYRSLLPLLFIYLLINNPCRFDGKQKSSAAQRPIKIFCRNRLKSNVVVDRFLFTYTFNLLLFTSLFDLMSVNYSDDFILLPEAMTES